MGDRVLMQCYSGEEFGPAVYGHWSGESAPAIVEKLRKQMQGRPDDLAYASARLVQCMIGTDTGNTGFGIWNVDHILRAEDTHGDAGVVLIDVSTP